MKKYDFPTLVRLLGIPALTALVGVVLLINPDSAAALIGKLLAGILILVGLVFGGRAIWGMAEKRTKNGIFAALCLAAGIWLGLRPLLLAESVGRIIGIFLLLQGIRNLAEQYRLAGDRFRGDRGTVIAGLTALAGLVLILVPLATSRFVFSICGIVLICVGIAEGYDRLRGRNYLEEGDDPNIIDAL